MGRYVHLAALLGVVVAFGATAWAAEPTAATAPATASAPADDSPIFDIPRMDKIVVDGNAADWGDGGFRIDLLVPPDGPIRKPSDYRSTARLGWNDKGLLVLATIHDDQFVEFDKTDELWRADCIELYMADQRGGKQMLQAVIAPGMDPNHPQLRHHIYDFRQDAALKTKALALTAASSKIPGGCTIEVLLPWENLGLTPKKGLEVGLQFFGDDLDPNKEQSHAVWYPAVGTFQYSDRMHRIRLADKPSPPFVATARANIDLRKLALPATVIAVASMAGKEAAIVQGDKTLASAKLAVDDTGLASGTMLLPPPPDGKSYENLQARLDGKLFRTLSIADSGLLTDVQPLVSRKDRLVKTYALDRPWDDMAAAPPIIRRHRGLAAWAMDMIGRSQRGQDFNLQNLSEVAGILAGVDKGEDYLATQRNSFWCAYLSRADGSGQPFVLRVPADLDANVPAPLAVGLHGKGNRPRPDPNAVVQGPMISAGPWGRGDLSWAGLGEDDVLEVIRCVRQMYNIDANRIYLWGWSMGGFGTWGMTCRYPDLFAAGAPTCGGRAELPMENLRNVPIFNEHGDCDWTVPIDVSRFCVATLQDMGYSVMHKEYPGGGHAFRSTFSRNNWFLQFTRPQRPAGVTLTCPSPARGKAYWACVKRLTDPHRLATVRATVSGYGEHQAVTLDLRNVDVLELDTTSMPLDPNAGLLVQAGLTLLPAMAPVPGKLYVLAGDGNASLAEKWETPAGGPRPFAAGAAAELYAGEPLLIVYGSAGSNSVFKAMAERLALSGGSDREMAAGRIPIKADRDVTADDLACCNLLLLGRPADNSLTARLADKLPIEVDSKNRLIAGARTPLSLDNALLSMIYYNPLSPQRLVYLVWFDPRQIKDANRFVQDAHNLLENAWGGDRVNSADLSVRSLDSPMLRRMQFTHEWKWRPMAGADMLIPARCAEPNWMPRTIARLLQQSAQADFGLFWAPDPAEKPWCDPNVFTLADCATDDGEQQTLVGEVSGEELVEIHRLRIAAGRLIASPPIDPARIEPARIYRLAMPPWIAGDLSSTRHKNLRNVHPGASAPAAAVRAEMHRAPDPASASAPGS